MAPVCILVVVPNSIENGAGSAYMLGQLHDTSLFFFAFCLFVCFSTLEKEIKLLEIQTGLEPEASKFSQMLLPTKPLELWHWRRG